MAKTLKVLYSTLAVVMIVNSFAIVFPAIGSAQSVADIETKAISSSNLQIEKRIKNLSDDLEANRKVTSKGISGKVQTPQDDKKVLDKYINKLGKTQLKKLATTFDKLDDKGKEKFLSKLSDVELNAFVAGVLMPYDQITKIENVPEKTSSKSASTGISAYNSGTVNFCNYTRGTSAYVDSYGSKIFEYGFTIYSCYSTLFNKVLGNSTFASYPSITYVKSGWAYTPMSGNMMGCDTSDRTFYSCTAGYTLKSSWWGLNFYKGMYIMLYRSLYNDPYTVKIKSSRW